MIQRAAATAFRFAMGAAAFVGAAAAVTLVVTAASAAITS